MASGCSHAIIDEPATGSDRRLKMALESGGSPQRLRAYYCDWSSTYDDDVAREGYRGPEYIVEFLLGLANIPDLGLSLEDREIAILDAACGTGLVGKALARRSFRRIDGCDLSLQMTDVARRAGIYRELHGGVDLVEGWTPFGVQQFDVVICCGAFIGSHLPPKALLQLVRLARPSGLVVISVRASYYLQTQFASFQRDLESTGRVSLLRSVFDAPYLDMESAHYLAFQVHS